MIAGTFSYGFGAVCFLALTVALATVWRGRLQGGVLLLAVGMSVVWCAVHAVFAATGQPDYALVAIVEVARNAAWYLFLMRVLGIHDAAVNTEQKELRWLGPVIGVLCIVMVAWIGAVYATGGLSLEAGTVSIYTYLGQVILAVIGLILVEQLYRNSRLEYRWAIKLLCLGLGGMFAFDLYMYSNALLLKELDPTLWSARGAGNAVVVPLLALAIARNKQVPRDLFISRHIAFHSAALLVAGSYLMLMAGAGYYIRSFGGSWGGVAQAVFLFGGIVILVMLLSSGQVRARISVLLSKHFFRNKYEYREVWLGFTEVLSNSADTHELKRNVISGIASLVDAPCGGLWERTSAGRFAPGADWNLDLPPHGSLDADASLISFLERSGWVVQLDELDAFPERYEGLAVPDWIDEVWKPWLIIPLLQGARLEAFIVLSESGTVKHLNWEDTDVLKTVGLQAAAHLAMMRVSDALKDAQQFDAFNRLSSYVVHDLKNVAAQLSLVASNSKRHIHNPEFVADAMDTVGNATAKMNRMLSQLKKGRLEETTTKLVNLRPILDKVVRARSNDQPCPRLRVADETLIVSADADRLASVMEHIVQNAQEATPADGRVDVVLRAECGWACVDVCDTGCGMDEDFVARRLFKPFDTTKGNAGMGIGVYESREFVTMWGGELQVKTAPGVGTTFSVRFPMDMTNQELKVAAGAVI